MGKQKAIINYAKYTDANLEVIATGTVTALTDNKAFTFANGELTALTNSADAYRAKLAAAVNGNSTAVIEKKNARANLLIALNTVAQIINLQANGDIGKLQTCGLPLTTPPQHRPQSVPLNLQVSYTDNSDIWISVDLSPVGDNGTVFAYTTANNMEKDPGLWTVKPINGHSTAIKDLVGGTAYKFTAAYKGNDDEDLIWAPPITKFAAN